MIICSAAETLQTRRGCNNIQSAEILKKSTNQGYCIWQNSPTKMGK